MAIKQLSVFVENRCGVIVELIGILAADGVDIRAMSTADTQDYGIIRMIVNDLDKALPALEKAGFPTSVTDVIVVAVSDEPGALTGVLGALSANRINIEYMYAFTSNLGGHANVVLRVDDNQRAEAVLNGIAASFVTREEICGK